MDDKIPKYVLDSFALLAHFQAENGGEKVRILLEKAGKKEAYLFMSMLNLGEVYYITSRGLGRLTAQSLLADTKALPIVICSVSDDQVIDAAELKAQYAISYADAFAASLAQMLQASVVTGDPEFSIIKDIVPISWIEPETSIH